MTECPEPTMDTREIVRQKRSPMSQIASWPDVVDRPGLDSETFHNAHIKLWALLSKRTAMYTLGDSSSVPSCVAYDLMSSVLYVLDIVSIDDPTVLVELSETDLDERFQRGIEHIESGIRECKLLWQEVCLSMPPIKNISLRDTLSSIGACWKKYDYQFFAHQVPCDIDYQLCHPVPDTLRGVDYVNEYLRRLSIESDFLKRFELSACIRLLQKASPDYRGLLINLYEPVAVDAMGLSLIGRDPLSLDIAEKDRMEIRDRLEHLSGAEMARALTMAADRLCDVLGISDENARSYMAYLGAGIQPRVMIALLNGNIKTVFS